MIAVAEKDERYTYSIKGACYFLGRSRWTVRRYRGTRLPDRTTFSEAELRACLESMKPQRRPGAAERIHMARKKNTEQPKAAPTNPGQGPLGEGAGAPVTSPRASEGHAPAPGTPPKEEAHPKKEEENPASSGTTATAGVPIPKACAGPSDPHHVEFPSGRPWREAAEKERNERDSGSPSSGWENPFGDWDVTQ